MANLENQKAGAIDPPPDIKAPHPGPSPCLWPRNKGREAKTDVLILQLCGGKELVQHVLPHLPVSSADSPYPQSLWWSPRDPQGVVMQGLHWRSESAQVTRLEEIESCCSCCFPHVQPLNPVIGMNPVSLLGQQKCLPPEEASLHSIQKETCAEQKYTFQALNSRQIYTLYANICNGKCMQWQLDWHFCVMIGGSNWEWKSNGTGGVSPVFCPYFPIPINSNQLLFLKHTVFLE